MKTFSIPTCELVRGGKYEFLAKIPTHLLTHKDALGSALKAAGFRLDGRIHIDDTRPGVVVLMQPESDGEM